MTSRIQEEAERSAALGASAPSALVALDGYLTGRPMNTLAACSASPTRAPCGSSTASSPPAAWSAASVRRDGRAVPLGLTPGGRRVARRVLAARDAALEDVLSRSEHRGAGDARRPARRLLGGMISSREDARRTCRMCDPVACGHHEGQCPVTQAADAAELRAVTGS